MNHDGNRFKISITFEPSHFESDENLMTFEQLFIQQGDSLHPLSGGVAESFGSASQWRDIFYIYESPLDAEKLHDLAVQLSKLCDVALNPVLKNLCEVVE